MSAFTANLTPKAIKDAEAAVNWYEEQKLGLGFDFSVELTNVLEQIADNPDGGRFLQKDVRFKKLKIFPYLVFYKILEAN